MSSNRKVICAGCSSQVYAIDSSFYRNKRWCMKESCKEIIDYKVKHSNYKKARKKMEKGTFRHGVVAELRSYIKNRDGFACRFCYKNNEEEQLQVHHIVPVSNGGDDTKTNLILLCSGCHTMVHKQGWDLYSKNFFLYTTKIEKSVVPVYAENKINTY